MLRMLPGKMILIWKKLRISFPLIGSLRFDSMVMGLMNILLLALSPSVFWAGVLVLP